MLRENKAFPGENELFQFEDEVFLIRNETFPSGNSPFTGMNEVFAVGNGTFPGREAKSKLLAQNILTGLAENAGDFPAPPVSPADLQAFLNSFITLCDEQVEDTIHPQDYVAPGVMEDFRISIRALGKRKFRDFMILEADFWIRARTRTIGCTKNNRGHNTK